MTMFDNLDEVKVFDSYDNSFFDPNIYIVEIQNIKTFEGEKGEFFIIEAEVLAKMNPDIGPKVGSIGVQMQKKTQPRATGQAAVKQFFIAAYEIDKKEQKTMSANAWKKLASRAIDEGSINGAVMKLKTWHITNTETGNIFTKHHWFGHATEEDLEEFDLV